MDLPQQPIDHFGQRLKIKELKQRLTVAKSAQFAAEQTSGAYSKFHLTEKLSVENQAMHATKLHGGRIVVTSQVFEDTRGMNLPDACRLLPYHYHSNAYDTTSSHLWYRHTIYWVLLLRMF